MDFLALRREVWRSGTLVREVVQKHSQKIVSSRNATSADLSFHCFSVAAGEGHDVVGCHNRLLSIPMLHCHSLDVHIDVQPNPSAISSRHRTPSSARTYALADRDNIRQIEELQKHVGIRLRHFFALELKMSAAHTHADTALRSIHHSAWKTRNPQKESP